MTEESGGWHLDKRVPITLILALLGHLVGSVWFFRGLVSEMEETRRRVASLEVARVNERVSERMAVMESQLTDTRAAALRMEVDVRKLVDRKSQ